MELLLVSAVEGLLPSLPVGDDRLADCSFDDVVILHRQDPRDVIAAYPGGRVLGVAAPETIRDVVATLVDLEPESLTPPERGSLTCMRASRAGTVSLMYYNDCLHVPSSVSSDREEVLL